MSRKKKHDHVNHERWLVSYADFITLLFAFFVVLFASSQSDKKKVQQVEYSIRTAFQSMGIFPATSKDPNLGSVAGAPLNTAVLMGDDLDMSPKVMADLNKIKRQMEQLLSEQIAHRTVSVQIGRDGLIISLREAGFFESGSATPKPESVGTLNAIGRALAVTPYNVRIEGHTDDVPIHNDRFASNWELSTMRATVLTRLFIESDHIAADRLAAAGYAEYHPVASNKTPEGRSRNRRVDIIVLPTAHHPVLEPGSMGEKQVPEFLSKAAQFSFAEHPSRKGPPRPAAGEAAGAHKRLLLTVQTIPPHLQQAAQGRASKESRPAESRLANPPQSTPEADLNR